jgi:hypothetical protein
MMKTALVLGSIFGLLAISAFAEPAKQIAVDMTTPLHEEDGSVSKHVEQATKDDPKCEKCEPVTLGFAINRALNMAFEDERGLPGEQKWARSLLGDRIKSDKAAALTAAETALIERMIEKAYPGFYIRQIIPLIDPNHPAPKIE